MKSPHLSRNHRSSKPAPAVTPRLRALLLCAGVAALALLPFVGAFRNQFVNWDDYETLVNNPHYRGWAWPQLRWMLTTFYMGHYQPLSRLSPDQSAPARAQRGSVLAGYEASAVRGRRAGKSRVGLRSRPGGANLRPSSA